ncbi:hypothetical protein HW555_002948 [Spodoptera exigua]|uniref:Uncharacterized protein n=1 Tax=Spodoptera exigua TaxID=7107 RepID=A0A835LDS9_SPOEX|nr:hypothetical protein HW555_002948 [Spodoptera exigua]
MNKLQYGKRMILLRKPIGAVQGHSTKCLAALLDFRVVELEMRWEKKRTELPPPLLHDKIRRSGCFTFYFELHNCLRYIYMQMSNVEAQNQNDTIVFFKDMDLVTISQRTIDLATFLESLVGLMNKGDRPVRRYFDSYSTPFAGFEEITFNNKPLYAQIESDMQDIYSDAAVFKYSDISV